MIERKHIEQVSRCFEHYAMLGNKESFGAVVAAIAAALAALEESPWRSMESAPRDGTKILVTGKTRKGQFYYVAKCRKYEHSGGHDWIDDSGCCYGREKITHWMPLPAAPEVPK